MIMFCRNFTKTNINLLFPSALASAYIWRYYSILCSPNALEFAHPASSRIYDQEEVGKVATGEGDVGIVITKVSHGNSVDEKFQSLMRDESCNGIRVDHDILDKLLHRFKDDWKSALAVFRWAESHQGYKPMARSYDMLVDILGKMKQMEKMRELVGEMQVARLVTLSTIAKVMRRLAGAGQWKEAVKIFDDLESFGLEKNTESMNLLLDTLCKANRVEQAREIFLELKPHIRPNAHTFNIFIHGWCKVKRVDEARWTIQEMKGHGCRPCAISYSTIIQSYCHQFSFHKVEELLDEMEAQGCPPNVVTYTSVMCSLTNAEEFDEALKIVERMKSAGCKPDTLFFNALIHTLGRAGRVKEAVHVFRVEMPKTGATPNTATYNSMIAMLCHHGQEQDALKVLKDLESSPDCKPDVQSYYPLLKVCFKTGRTGSPLNKLLDEMVNKHHLSLDLATYTLLIHGLCRANKCEHAYKLFEEMIGKEITPRYVTCRLLLDEIQQKSLYVAADRVEEFMRQMKSTK